MTAAVRPLLLLTAVSATAPAGAARVLEPVLLPAESFTETFSAVADLDGGAYVQLQLAVTNAGLGSARGVCRVLVVTPGGEPWTATDVVDRRGWRFEASPAPSLAVGRCLARAAAGVVSVSAAVGGGLVELTLHAGVSSVSPPDHRLLVRSGLYEYEVLVPWAAVDVVVDVSGRGREAQRGAGFLDHSRSTALPGDVARAWLRFRALGGACPTLALLRVPPRESAASGWVWQRDAGSTPRAVGAVTGLPALTSKMPASFTAVMGEVSLRITPQLQLFRHAPAEDHGLVGRLVAAWAGKAVTTTYRAVADGLGSCGPVSGILELTRVD